MIQFVVITNGAGRVAEVAARFTLDAMPGKQMAIDADLNTGQITDAEARHAPLRDPPRGRLLRCDGRRVEVREGRCDGRRLIIVSINLIGGIIVGVVEHHLSFSDAIHRFSLLTVGDGLAAQIPALLISTATGVIVTRSGSETNLGSEITGSVARPAAARRCSPAA